MERGGDEHRLSGGQAGAGTPDAGPGGVAPPKRVQLRRTKGWRMPPNTVKVDRTTRWGNPFNLKHHSHCWTAIAFGFRGDSAGRHAACIAMFRSWVLTGKGGDVADCGLYAEADGKHLPVATSPTITVDQPPSIAEIREHLAGKNLACWCKPDQPCHADVLLELANCEGEP